MFEPASKSMPAIDYVSTVRAVYTDRRAMVMAVLSCAVAASAAAVKTGSPLLWGNAAVFVLIARAMRVQELNSLLGTVKARLGR